MRNFLLLTLLFVSLVVRGQQEAYTPLPYFCGFESPEDTIGTYGWKFEAMPKTAHCFAMGTAVHRMGSYAMYVSTDGGKTASYSNRASGSVVIAYKSFYLEKGTYDLMFEYRLQGEDLEESDVMRVAFYTGAKPTPTASGIAFPNYMLTNAFKDKDGEEVFKSSLWRQIEGQVVVNEPGYHYLVFAFKEDGDKNVYSPGACIDNIQFDKVKSPTACATKPTNIQIDKEPTGIKLSWTGRADSYEIMYNRVSSLTDTLYSLVSGITTTEYMIPYSTIPEGVYNFRIRSLCSNDTSMWIEKPNFIVYDDSKHCLNYMDLSASGTVCEYGNFANPAQVNRVIDYGYENRKSIHTIHYMNDEYDRLTGYKLKTVPEGQIASVRLGNWTEGAHGDSPVGGSPSGRITYTYTIPLDKTVLLLHYAAVLQYAPHHPANDQTRIIVEIKNSRGATLECATANFNAREVAENPYLRGWKTYQPKEGEVIDHDCEVKWLDWSVIGMNLQKYAGQTVKICLTLKACVADFHFAYGYFALDCTAGEVGGMSCTEKADTLFVPEGFNYVWYVQGDDTKKPVSTERFFVPEENDINSYAVDLIYPEENGCYFTLYANVWPRVPKVQMNYAHRPKRCVNYVELINNSKMIDLKMDKEGNVVDTLDVAPLTASIKDYYLEIDSKKGTKFENGMTVSSDPTMKIVVPNEGDTFKVVIRGMFNSCEDMQEIEVKAPAIGVTKEEVTSYICLGGEVEFNGKTYTETGVYIDTLTSEWCGCDSILKLTLETLVADTIRDTVVICSAEAPYYWRGEMLDTTGIYRKGLKSSLGCDTLYYILDLTVLETLVVKIDGASSEICSGDPSFEIGYNVIEGMVSGYSILYSDKAKEAGFVDDDMMFEMSEVVKGGASGAIEFLLPEEVRPDKYDAKLVLFNEECGNAEVPVAFDVFYSNEVIAQRWNDVLSLKNKEYNGGYEFTAYQWLLNGEPIEGAVASQLYELDKNLDFDGIYQVALTRADDAVTTLTCGFTPRQFTEQEMSEMGKLVFANDVVDIESPQEAKGYIYNMSGLIYSQFDLVEGTNSVQMPGKSGVYIMKLDCDSGDTKILKIIVR